MKLTDKQWNDPAKMSKELLERLGPHKAAKVIAEELRRRTGMDVESMTDEELLDEIVRRTAGDRE